MKKLILILTVILSIFSCREDDCYTPPEPTIFKFVNINNENLISNGTISTSNIFIQENVGNGNYNGVQFEKTDDNKILLKNIGNNDGIKNYDVYINLEPEIKKFSFTLKSSKITGKCSGYKVENITFQNITEVKENGYYKLTIE